MRGSRERESEPRKAVQCSRRNKARVLSHSVTFLSDHAVWLFTTITIESVLVNISQYIFSLLYLTAQWFIHVSVLSIVIAIYLRFLCTCVCIDKDIEIWFKSKRWSLLKKCIYHVFSITFQITYLWVCIM